MNMPGPVPGAASLPEDEAPASAFANRFLLVTVSSQRVLQLRAGARLRVDARGHKHCTVAVAEVLAGCVTYQSS